MEYVTNNDNTVTVTLYVNDEVLTASVVVVTTLLGAVTLTIWIFILKTVGLIG